MWSLACAGYNPSESRNRKIECSVAWELKMRKRRRDQPLVKSKYSVWRSRKSGRCCLAGNWRHWRHRTGGGCDAVLQRMVVTVGCSSCSLQCRNLIPAERRKQKARSSESQHFGRSHLVRRCMNCPEKKKGQQHLIGCCALCWRKFLPRCHVSWSLVYLLCTCWCTGQW